MMEGRFNREIGMTTILPRLVQGSDEEKETMQIFDWKITTTISPHVVHRFSFQREFSSPDFPNFCPEFEQIRLPRSYPLGHRLPENSVVPVFEWTSLSSRGSMVFAFDEANSQLYHLVTKEEDSKYPFGGEDAYVAVEDTLYYVGGHYGEHDVTLAFNKACREISATTDLVFSDRVGRARSMAEAEVKKKLEVETYNFVTGKWEDKANLTQLNRPKPGPIVFVFDNKLYALAGRKPYSDLGDNFKSFEFLNISTAKTEKGSTWTVLPPPPFLVLQDSRHILWKEKKCLFVKVSDKATKRRKVLLWKFDLQSHKWYNNSSDPSDEYHDPESYEFLTRLTDVPAELFEGCIVNDMLFHFEDNKEKPEPRLLVGYDLRRKKILRRRWEIDLKTVLGNVGQGSTSVTFLSHVSNDTFCILVKYKPHPQWFVNFLCICLFDLKCGDDQMSLDEWKAFNPNELSFHVTRPRCHYFQMPNQVALTYRTKLEGGSP